jgi:hypothetical protein
MVSFVGVDVGRGVDVGPTVGVIVGVDVGPASPPHALKLNNAITSNNKIRLYLLFMTSLL